MNENFLHSDIHGTGEWIGILLARLCEGVAFHTTDNFLFLGERNPNSQFCSCTCVGSSFLKYEMKNNVCVRKQRHGGQ